MSVALFDKPKLKLNVDALASQYEGTAPTINLPEQFCPHKPDPGSPQEEFLKDMRKEILYGGAAGGGKSDALLMAALQFVHKPNYAAIIFRKTYTDLSLEGALMERAHEWLDGTGARWSEAKKRWRFPSGASLTFAYLASSLDKFRYQSAEFDYIAFDEISQFPESDYLYLFSRLRRLIGSNIPSRMRCGSNPGGIGHRWLKARFIDPHLHGSDNPDRRFVPAKLSDNRHIDQESYRANLQELDEHTRKQLEEGDWEARIPGPWVYDHTGLDAAFQIGDEYDEGERDLPPPIDNAIPLGIDFGETTHVLLGWPLEQGGMFIAYEYVYHRGEPDSQAQEFVRTVLKQKRFVQHPLGRQRFDSSKPESMRLWLRGMREAGMLDSEGRQPKGKPSPIPFNKHKRGVILHHRQMLKKAKDGEPFGFLAISGKNCPVLKEQIYDLQFKEDDTEDVVKKFDHGPDAAIALDAPLVRKRVVS